MKKNRIIAGVLSAVIVTGTVVGIALSQRENPVITQPTPTPSATAQPTEEPSLTPESTIKPTIEPTTKPSDEPSLTPSPTTEPTVEPTEKPIEKPRPTAEPTPKPEVTNTPVPPKPTETAKPVVPSETPNPTPVPDTATPQPTPSTAPNTGSDYPNLIPNPVTTSDFAWNRYITKGCTVCGSHGTCNAFNVGTHTFTSVNCENYNAEESTYCSKCGKVKGNGTNGTCLIPMADSECYYCGEEIYAGKCHTCK